MTRSSRFSAVLIALASSTAVAEVKSGPAAGEKAPALTVAVVTGEFANQSVDFPAKREGKPTVYVFIPGEKWNRPTARLLKKLDQDLTAASAEAVIVGVWLTADVAKTKEYLPRAQQSLQLEHSSLTAYEGATSPDHWNIDTEADATVVVTKGGKVTANFGFETADETLADGVIEALKKE